MGQRDVRKNTNSPEEHHQPRQAICLLLLPIVPYLRHQLYAPEDSADCTEDVSGNGNAGLGCHVLNKILCHAVCEKTEVNTEGILGEGYVGNRGIQNLFGRRV